MGHGKTKKIVVMAPTGRHGGFQEVDQKVMVTVGGALLVIVVLGCVVGAALSPYMTPLSWKVSVCSTTSATK